MPASKADQVPVSIRRHRVGIVVTALIVAAAAAAGVVIIVRRRNDTPIPFGKSTGHADETIDLSEDLPVATV